MNILTFDIEDWFHTHLSRKHYSGHIWDQFPPRVEVNTHKILDFLDQYQHKATFFILGWVADQHPSLIKEIHAGGHEIGAHSYWHHHARLLSKNDFETDLQRCLGSLGELTGKQIQIYRAPGYSLHLRDNAYFDILSRNGITIDSSVQLRGNEKNYPLHITTQTHTILEFPLTTTSFGMPYSGGGYFRLLPENILKNLFQPSRYRMLYFHPRDFDANYPYTNLFSTGRNWLNSVHTGSCMTKLSHVLDQKTTYSLGEAAVLLSSGEVVV